MQEPRVLLLLEPWDWTDTLAHPDPLSPPLTPPRLVRPLPLHALCALFQRLKVPPLEIIPPESPHYMFPHNGLFTARHAPRYSGVSRAVAQDALS